MFQNPDRGFRLEAYVDVNSEEYCDQYIKSYNPKFEAAASKVNPGIWAKPKLVQLYFYLTDYKDTEILPEFVFNNMQKAFDAVRAEGQRGVVRFAYQGGIYESENQARPEIMYKHMEQLKPFLEKNKAAICTLEAGFLGAWGEWHAYTPYYYLPEFTDKYKAITDEHERERYIWNNTPEFDQIELIKHIVDMTPEEIPVQIRQSTYRDFFLEAYPNMGYEKRLGLKNDAFFGFVESDHAWPYNSMTSKASKSAMAASTIAPMGGEFFWGCQWPYPRVTGEEAILSYKHFHQSIFSIFHNSFECTEEVAGRGENQMWFAGDREGDMSIWAKTPITSEDLERMGVYASPAWFCDADGNSVERTQFEYIRDHLGYRLEAKSFEISGELVADSTAEIKLSLVNHGFAPVFNLKSEIVVLDTNNKPVVSFKAGNPTDWYNENELTVHTVTEMIKLPKTHGNYKLALRLYNTANEGAYLANEIEHIDGYNILCTLDI